MKNWAAVPVYPLKDECRSPNSTKKGLFLFACALASQASSSCSTFCIQAVWLNTFPAFPLLLHPPALYLMIFLTLCLAVGNEQPCPTACHYGDFYLRANKVSVCMGKT